MGYYTKFELSWSTTPAWKPLPPCAHENSSEAKFCQECGVSLRVVLDEAIGAYIKLHEQIRDAVTERGGSVDRTKWYEHEADLREMSRRFPGVLFKLTGDGEESGDLWAAYALDGKWQKHKARVVVGDCDPKGWT